MVFEYADIIVVLTLVLLEGLLSVDNAVVLAVMVRHLPDKQQKRALRYGIIGAFAFRIIAVFFVSQLLGFNWLQLVGGLYLLGISVKHSLDRQQVHAAGVRGQTARPPRGIPFLSPLWSTVVMVELADIVFSIDSILAAVAMVPAPPADHVGLHPKMWVIVTGGFLGIITMRMVAGVFLKLIDRFPKLVDGAYVIIAVIGVKLILVFAGVHVQQWLVIGIIMFIFVLSLLMKERKMSTTDAKEFMKNNDFDA